MTSKANFSVNFRPCTSVEVTLAVDGAVLLGRLGQLARGQREVHRLRQLPGGCDPAVLQLRGSLGQVIVEELSDVVLIDRNLISTRLGDETVMFSKAGSS